FEPVRRTIPLGPGARFDVMCDLPGNAGAEANVTLLGDNEPDRVLLAFKTAGEKRSPLPPVASLTQNLALPREIKLQASRKLDILIEAITPPGSVATPPLYWKLNGVGAPRFSAAPLFFFKRGTPAGAG